MYEDATERDEITEHDDRNVSCDYKKSKNTDDNQYSIYAKRGADDNNHHWDSMNTDYVLNFRTQYCSGAKCTGHQTVYVISTKDQERSEGDRDSGAE